jgi:hypothetical protein
MICSNSEPLPHPQAPQYESLNSSRLPHSGRAETLKFRIFPLAFSMYKNPPSDRTRFSVPKGMHGKGLLLCLELLETHHVRSSFRQPSQEVVEPLIDVVNVEGGDFQRVLLSDRDPGFCGKLRPQ